MSRLARIPRHAATACLVTAATTLAALVALTPAAHALGNGHLQIMHVDVGQGDGALLISPGGQTALFVAQTAGQRAPQWNFLGTVALAPASTLEALIPLAEATHDPVEQAYLIYALEGLSTVDAHVQVEQLLTTQARSVLADTTTGCIDDITNDLTRRHLDHLFAVNSATLTRLNTELGHYDDPDQHRAAKPILIAQGTVDNDVPQGATDGLTSRLCTLGDRLEYRLFPGLDHNNLVAGSLNFVEAWITARFEHRSAATTCNPRSRP